MEKELILYNRREEISQLASFIEEFVSQAGLAEELVFSFNLALEEAVSNIILYAYPPDEEHTLSLKARRDGNIVTFILGDTGKEFDPTSVPVADINLGAEEREIGGLGIFLIGQIMDYVEYQRIENKNILTLKKMV
jgi:anti-sigma regulatory factor (Ser/Thr protein kinase)